MMAMQFTPREYPLIFPADKRAAARSIFVSFPALSHLN